jgi:hypothetical protein
MAVLALACATIGGCAPDPGIVDVAMPPSDPIGVGGPAVDPLFLPVVPGAAQRRLLPNDTALPGENYVLALPNRGFTGRTPMPEILRIVGPLPHPFEYAIARDFVPIGASGLGYVRATPEEGVTCVLVAGDGGALSGAGSPIFMRNCVRGDLRSALAPATSISSF